LRIRISIRSGCTILTLSGALDEEAAATVRWTLLTRLAAKPWALICDLHAVPFADPKGLTALTACMRRGSSWTATRIVLCGVQPAVVHAFQYLDIDQIGVLPPLCDTLDEAILCASTGRPPRSARFVLGRATDDDARMALGETCERWGVDELSPNTAPLARMLIRWGSAGMSCRRGRLLQTLLAAVGRWDDRAVLLQVELRQDLAHMPDDPWAPAEPDEHGDRLLRVKPSLKPPGLRLEGEVDASNIVALAAALAIAVAAMSEVRLDLAGLESINLAGVCLLARTAKALTPDGALVLDPLPSHLRRLMRLAGLDQTPGLRLGGSV
jgi:anti-anti-sigma regulatory factor